MSVIYLTVVQFIFQLDFRVDQFNSSVVDQFKSSAIDHFKTSAVVHFSVGILRRRLG